MAIIDQQEIGSARKTAGYAVLGLVALIAVAYWILPWWNRPPQMGADEEVFRTVDALFTAVGAKNEKQLAQCEERLRSYQENGQITEDASNYLDGVITLAKEGQWTTATQRLYPFMLAQRRDGGEDAPAKKKTTGKANPKTK